MVAAEAGIIAEIVDVIEEARLYECMLWRYEAVGDDRTCPECARCDGEIFEVEDSDELLDIFPYGEFMGAATFRPNVHPNCRCAMRRIYSGKSFSRSETSMEGLGSSSWALSPLFPAFLFHGGGKPENGDDEK